jgi:NAD-dependent deacetylase
MTVPPQLIDRLKSAQRVVVLTGAGVSAESGVPTFRDAQTGLWSKFNPEELATPRAFRRNRDGETFSGISSRHAEH